MKKTGIYIHGVIVMIVIAGCMLPIVDVSSSDKFPIGKGFGGAIVSELSKAARKGVIYWSCKLVHNFYLSLFDNIPTVVAANPPMWSIKHFIGFFINLLQPFYILAIILTGFYIIFVSQSSRDRAKAKFWFGKLIVGLVLISVSPLIVELMFYVSGTVTSQIMNLADVNLALGSFKAGMNKIWSIFWGLTFIHRHGGAEIFILDMLFFILIYILLVLRYVMVGLLAALLPLTILLYSFDLTRHLGKALAEQTIVWTFMQISWALGLTVVSLTVAILPSDVLELPVEYIYFTSVVFIFAVPFMILGVMNWLGFAILVFETVQAAPLSTGAVFFGETAMEREPFVEEEVVVKPPEDY